MSEDNTVIKEINCIESFLGSIYDFPETFFYRGQASIDFKLIPSIGRFFNNDITLLKCTSSYPTPLEKSNLLTIPDMIKRFPRVKIGVSDHSMSNTVPITAVALGATVVEKHLILDRKMGGPDSGFSMEPDEFRSMVQSIREVEKVLGKVSYPEHINQIEGRQGCRSLFICKDMKKGDLLTNENLRSIRPGYGLHPKYLSQLLGKTVNRDLEMGTPMSLDFVD